MKEENNGRIQIIRTRGPLLTPTESGRPRLESESNRGDVRTRGMFATSIEKPTQESTTLDIVLLEIRHNVNNLPLTFVIHHWNIPSALEFTRLLQSLMRARDVLWLVSDDAQDVPTPPEGVPLVMTHDEDSRIYNMIVADVVFFPAANASEWRQVSRWRQCTNEVVVAQHGPYANSVMEECRRSVLVAHIWDRGMTLKSV